jgi:hypothetical protein
VRHGEARRNRPYRTPATEPRPIPGGAEILDRLRGPVGRRPRVDPGLAGGLRAWLEDGVAVVAAGISDPRRPLVVTSRDMSQFKGKEASTDRPSMTIEMARGAIVHTLFRQLLTVGHVGRPLDDALDAFDVDQRRGDVAAFVRNLKNEERRLLAEEVAAHTAQMRRHFPALAAGWFPRTNDRIAVPLAGARVLLADNLDLLVGAPSAGAATVCLVDVASGQPSAHHRSKRHFQGLVETLRSGAPPFRTATYFSATGEMEVEDVTDDQLAASVQRVLDVISQIGGVAR